MTRFAGDALDGNNALDVYLRDLAAATTQLVSRKGAAGPAGADRSNEPAIDADGSHVAFSTDATDFSAIPDANMSSDVWVRDVSAGQVALASRAASADATADDGSFAPAISADGNRVAFASLATNLVSGFDVNGDVRDVFVRDMGAARPRSPAARREPTGSRATAARNGRRSTRPAPASHSRRLRPIWSRVMPTAPWTSSCATRSRRPPSS